MLCLALHSFSSSSSPSFIVRAPRRPGRVSASSRWDKGRGLGNQWFLWSGLGAAGVSHISRFYRVSKRRFHFVSFASLSFSVPWRLFSVTPSSASESLCLPGSAQPLSPAVNVKFRKAWLTGSASLQEAGLECNRRWRRGEGGARPGCCDHDMYTCITCQRRCSADTKCQQLIMSIEANALNLIRVFARPGRRGQSGGSNLSPGSHEQLNRGAKKEMCIVHSSDPRHVSRRCLIRATAAFTRAIKSKCNGSQNEARQLREGPFLKRWHVCCIFPPASRWQTQCPRPTSPRLGGLAGDLRAAARPSGRREDKKTPGYWMRSLLAAPMLSGGARA